MTHPYLRGAALALLFAVGILPIMATSPPPPPYHFRNVEIRPTYRCTGADVAVSWKLSLPAAVTVVLDGRTLGTTDDNWFALPAAQLDRTGPAAELELRIAGEEEEVERPATYDINTLRDEEVVELLAFRRDGMKFATFQQDIWDDRARVTGVSIKQVNYLLCARGAESPPAWEVTPPSGESFLVHAADNYSASSVPVRQAGGIWRLRAKGGECRWPAIGQPPYLSLRLTASCSATP